MKTVIQALVISFALHLTYLVGETMVSVIKTWHYEPIIFQKAKTVQHEVAFGTVNSPFLFLITFFGVAFITGFILSSSQKKA
ncbi:hypothetical protein [Massilibacterium senegalense]|uniref:hypothetical protein n=1 Tax=Massilibacterium senegalense TaxID=1632858 RepID=UPI000783867F|nr:hypothetical protein [Massilibacterium senegalense]